MLEDDEDVDDLGRLPGATRARVVSWLHSQPPGGLESSRRLVTCLARLFASTVGGDRWMRAGGETAVRLMDDLALPAARDFLTLARRWH